MRHCEYADPISLDPVVDRKLPARAWMHESLSDVSACHGARVGQFAELGDDVFDRSEQFKPLAGTACLKIGNFVVEFLLSERMKLLPECHECRARIRAKTSRPGTARPLPDSSSRSRRSAS